MAIDQRILRPTTPLILPTAEFITAPKGNSPEIVAALLDDIKRLLHISEAKIEVAPLERLPAKFRHSYANVSEIAGTWQGDGDQAVIHYDPERASQPIPFIATLAHEVMHHRLHAIDEFPPGGPEAEELSTDLHCITSGFGLFQMAGAEIVGWKGYMRQPTRAHALAMFLLIRDIAPTEALSRLPPRSAKSLKRALQEIAKSPAGIEPLRIALSGF